MPSSFRGFKARFRTLNKATNLIEVDNDGKCIHRWVEWWYKRRDYVFRAFVPLLNTCFPKMNQAETIYASWVKRDRMNMSLLDATHSDDRDNVQLEVEYSTIIHRGGGKYPSPSPTLR